MLWKSDPDSTVHFFVCHQIEIRPSFHVPALNFLCACSIDRPQSVSFKSIVNEANFGVPFPFPNDKSVHLCFQGGRCLGVRFLACRNYHFIKCSTTKTPIGFKMTLFYVRLFVVLFSFSSAHTHLCKL